MYLIVGNLKLKIIAVLYIVHGHVYGGDVLVVEEFRMFIDFLGNYKAI